jgi:toxin-antitoxin system PIN domain toxin
MPRTLLPDVNVWLALAFDGHVHHSAAQSWFDGFADDDICFFCRLTQQGFLRLATNPAVFGRNAVTLPEAWQKYDLFLSDPRVEFADEPANIEDPWRVFTQHKAFSPHVWNDAYLAGFAVTGNMDLVTFDSGLLQYQPARCIVLR